MEKLIAGLKENGYKVGSTTAYIESDTVAGKITCSKSNKNDESGYSSFVIEDIIDYGFDGDILDVCGIFIYDECRNKNEGSKLIKIVCDTFDDCLITASAGVSSTEYTEAEYDAMSVEEKGIILDKVCNFLQKNDFVDVNHLIGQYEEKVAHIYTGNKIGKDFVNKIMGNDK